MQKKIIYHLSLLFLWIGCWGCESPIKTSPKEEIKKVLVQDYQQLQTESEKLHQLIQNREDQKILIGQFQTARLAYKRVEPLLSFYYPDYSLVLNGAAIDKTDYHDINRKILPATGFQVVEEELFTDEINWQSLEQEAGILHGAIYGLEREVESIQLTDENIWQATRLQLLRVLSLGLSGFDSPVSFYSIPEALVSYETIKTILTKYQIPEEGFSQLDRTIEFLKSKDLNFLTLDRGQFIRDYANPLAQEIWENQQSLEIGLPILESPVDLRQGVFYAIDNFNPAYFAPAQNRSTSAEQINLGKTLFFDPILSGTNQVACATCHQPEAAFADHQTLAIAGEGSAARNTPTLLYSSLQNAQFMDRRVGYLEDQAVSVMNNRQEMHGSFQQAVDKLNQNETYRIQFAEVYQSDSIQGDQVVAALSAYIRTLQPNTSKFDRYLAAEGELTEQELRGFTLFMGKGKCGTCHFYPLFNGGVPPFYGEVESEVLGVPSKALWENATIDEDLGEFEILEAELKKFAFKTPTVRNSALTWPYMHNGVYVNLEEVMKFYNLGGGAGIGIELANQTLPTDPLNLSETEIQDIIAFLHSLTDSQ
ncbi:cytochrome-c peroxidase [Algoriphagus namhaensis]